MEANSESKIIEIYFSRNYVIGNIRKMSTFISVSMFQYSWFEVCWQQFLWNKLTRMETRTAFYNSFNKGHLPLMTGFIFIVDIVVLIALAIQR